MTEQVHWVAGVRVHIIHWHSIFVCHLSHALPCVGNLIVAHEFQDSILQETLATIHSHLDISSEDET